jgi:hypothetical protein
MLSESDQQRADFERHRAEPDVSVDDYLRRRQIELGRSLEGRRIVYLDMWVWNRISDHILKGTNDPSMAALHRRLLAEAAAGRVVCPVSESIFLELMKQSDPRTRMAAAEVIDALGGGACLMAPDTRINTEVAHWVYESATTKSLVPLDHLVWTVVPYVLGAMHPVDNRFPAAEQRVIQKAFIDRLWRTRLVDMVQTLDQPKWKFDAMEGIAQRLNDGNRNHLAELTSFRKVYADEATGGADLFAPMARRIIADMYTKETGQPPPEASDGTQQTERTLRALMAKSLIDGGSRHVLRSLHIQAACHAAVRWNRGQKLSANTLFDFHHATAALAYCDAFLCDRPMAAFLTAGLIILDQEMGCFVASTAEALMAWLDERLPSVESVALSEPAVP